MNNSAKVAVAGKRELQKEARRIAIIDAALEEFTAQGFSATKLDDVAERAGIGKGTIYLYFDSKEKLFEDVVRRNLMPQGDVAQQYLDCLDKFEGSASEVLANHFRHIYSVMQSDKVQSLLPMILNETVKFPKLTRFFYEEMISPSHQLIRLIIQKGVASGEFRASAGQVYTQLLFAPVMHGVLWNRQFGELAPIDIDNYAETHIEFMLLALKA